MEEGGFGQGFVNFCCLWLHYVEPQSGALGKYHIQDLKNIEVAFLEAEFLVGMFKGWFSLLGELIVIDEFC